MLDVDAVLVNIRTNHNLHNNQIFLEVYMNLGMSNKICSNIQNPNSPSDPFWEFWNYL